MSAGDAENAEDLQETRKRKRQDSGRLSLKLVNRRTTMEGSGQQTGDFFRRNGEFNDAVRADIELDSDKESEPAYVPDDDEDEDMLDGDVSGFTTARSTHILDLAPGGATSRIRTGMRVPKKISIINFGKNKKPKIENVLAEQWPTLEECIVAIQTRVPVRAGLEQLYQIVERVCSAKESEELYRKLRDVVYTSVSQRIAAMDDRSVMTNSSATLTVVNDYWNEYCQQMRMICNVFVYLDRSQQKSLWDEGQDIFRDVLESRDNVLRRTTDGILELIHTERMGNQVNRSLLRSLLHMFSSISVYKSVFHFPFIDATRKLYETEGQTLSRQLEVADYLAHVERRLTEEEGRADFLLNNTSKADLMVTTERALITTQQEYIIQKGLEQLLETNNVEALALLYRLLSRTDDGHNLLRSGFLDYAKKIGRALVMDTDGEKTLVQDLMALKERLDNIVTVAFKGSERFAQAVKDAFDVAVNGRPNKPAELIAKFMDSRLRAGNKESTEEELDTIMNKVITLFRSIHGKDVFEAFYKKDLAKRLLLGRSASVDAEKAMLSKLKQECGAGFTQKLDGMFKDMDLSKDLAAAFRQVSNMSDFSVNVLTLGQWPTYPPSEVHLPPELTETQLAFQNFYLAKHSGRKLIWQHSLAQCVLKATFANHVRKELQVSLYQTIVLLLFNKKTEWSIEDIQMETNMEFNELCRTLQSLACGRLRVLTKNPKSKEVAKGDTFAFNEVCNDKLFRIRISQVQMKETKEEHEQTEEQVSQDRLYAIDAAIVRIMKARKTLTHQQLVTELFSQLRFPVNSSDIRPRIGSLIERDYLDRDESDMNVYKYIA